MGCVARVHLRHSVRSGDVHIIQHEPLPAYMRTRQEINDEFARLPDTDRSNQILLEVFLDIRDLLSSPLLDENV